MQLHTHLDLDEGAIAEAVATERLRVFNERSISGAFSSFAGIALLAWVIGASAGLLPAVSWASLMTAGELAILFTGYRCRRALSGAGRAVFWRNGHFVLVGLCGIVWGSAVWFVWREGDWLSYLVTMAILVGVAGVSMVTMASYATAGLLFIPGIYFIPLLQVLQFAGSMKELMTAGLVTGMVVQLAYTRELGMVVIRDVQQNVRNAALVERLNDLLIHDQLTGACSRATHLSRWKFWCPTGCGMGPMPR